MSFTGVLTESPLLRVFKMGRLKRSERGDNR
jgi:hypothetical protein